MSFILGLTCLEVSDVIFLYLKRVEVEDPTFVSEIFIKASEFLALSVKILKHEDPMTLEGSLYRKAFEMEKRIESRVLQNF